MLRGHAGTLFRLCAPLTLAALATHAPLRAQGDVLYAVRGTDLVEIDTATLTATVLGSTGLSRVGGACFDGTGALFGLDTTGDDLVRIDPATGASTVIGSVGVSVTFSTGMDDDPTTDTLYAVSTQGAGFSSYLVTLSKSTGAASGVADTSASALVGLGFDAAGQLWAIDGGTGREELVRIDKATGALTVVAPQGMANHPSIGCFDVGPSGTFWAIESLSATGSYDLLEVNPATGTATVRGSLGGIAYNGTVMTGLTSRGGAGGPFLTVSGLVAGGTAGFDVFQATPGGPVGIGYSITGGGPSTAAAGPCGAITVDLSAPIRLLPILTANASGRASATAAVPPGTTGITVWFHALDVGSCTLTNSLSLLIS